MSILCYPAFLFPYIIENSSTLDRMFSTDYICITSWCWKEGKYVSKQRNQDDRSMFIHSFDRFRNNKFSHISISKNIVWIFQQLHRLVHKHFLTFILMGKVLSLTPFSTLFQLYRGIYWWRKPDIPEKTTELQHVTGKRHHKILYLVHLAREVFELTTLVVIWISPKEVYHYATRPYSDTGSHNRLGLCMYFVYIMWKCMVVSWSKWL